MTDHKPFAPLAARPTQPISPLALETLAKLQSGQARVVRPDEKIDVAAANARGETPEFIVVPKAQIDALRTPISTKPGALRGGTAVASIAEVAFSKAPADERQRPVTAGWNLTPDQDGKVTIPITDDVRRRLDSLKREGETDEDVINRVLDEKRNPTYPEGTPERRLAHELNASVFAAHLDPGAVEDVRRRLARLPYPERYAHIKRQMAEVLTEGDQDKLADRLGTMMAFVGEFLTPEDGHRLAEELLTGSIRDDYRVMDETAKEAAERLESAMDGLPPERQAAIVRGIIENNFGDKTGDPIHDLTPGFASAVTRHLMASKMAREAIGDLLANDRIQFTPSQRDKLERAMGSPPKDAIKTARAVITEKKRDNADERKIIDLQLQAAEDIAAIAAAPVLQRLGETGWHKAATAMIDGNIILPTSAPGHEVGFLQPNLSPSIFVVQHDWAAAFENAKDFADGEFQMPYDHVVFEFRISGRRVGCSIAKHGEDDLSCALFIETSAGWALGAGYYIKGGNWNYYTDKEDMCAPILNLCRAQIRAVFIALEAEVVVTEVVRAPHRLNRKRERAGKLPVFDHHVVCLANRRRYLPRDAQPGDIEDEQRHRRLHFVRGHWRNYLNHRVWIKWHLRGDPDLGFVEKHYKL